MRTLTIFVITGSLLLILASSNSFAQLARTENCKVVTEQEIESLFESVERVSAKWRSSSGCRQLCATLDSAAYCFQQTATDPGGKGRLLSALLGESPVWEDRSAFYRSRLQHRT